MIHFGVASIALECSLCKIFVVGLNNTIPYIWYKTTICGAITGKWKYVIPKNATGTTIWETTNTTQLSSQMRKQDYTSSTHIKISRVNIQKYVTRVAQTMDAEPWTNKKGHRLWYFSVSR